MKTKLELLHMTTSCAEGFAPFALLIYDKRGKVMRKRPFGSDHVFETSADADERLRRALPEYCELLKDRRLPYDKYLGNFEDCTLILTLPKNYTDYTSTAPLPEELTGIQYYSEQMARIDEMDDDEFDAYVEELRDFVDKVGNAEFTEKDTPSNLWNLSDKFLERLEEADRRIEKRKEEEAFKARARIEGRMTDEEMLDQFGPNGTFFL